MSATGILLDAIEQAIDLTPAETAVTEYGRAVLAAADDDFWYPCSEQGRGLIRYSREGLRESLADHAGLLDGSRHPASVFADHADHRDDALAVALQRVTEDIAAWAGDLVAVIAEHAGDEAAEAISGRDGGQS